MVTVQGISRFLGIRYAGVKGAGERTHWVEPLATSAVRRPPHSDGFAKASHPPSPGFLQPVVGEIRLRIQSEDAAC